MNALLNQVIHQLMGLIRQWSCYFGLAIDYQNLEYTFHQLLHDRNYDEARKLALQHKELDMDLVYKCKWRNTNITVQLIKNVLAKIQDKMWVLNECVQTVPVSNQACRCLIEFGLELSLQKTSKKNDDESVGEQEELNRYRENLVHYEHSLTAYENILGDYKRIQHEFDHVFYEEFRRKPILESCLEFANGGDIHAVEICLNFYDLDAQLLTIISNVPETLSPYEYQHLLSRICLSDNFARDAIMEWYLQRASEMEEKTLLPSSATQLLEVGIELGVRNLQEARNDLVEFYRIVYDCFTESNMYLSYNEFKKMSLKDKLNCTTNTETKYRLLAFALAKSDDLDSIKIIDHIICMRKRDIKIHWAYCEQYS